MVNLRDWLRFNLNDEDLWLIWGIDFMLKKKNDNELEIYSMFYFCRIRNMANHPVMEVNASLDL